MLQEEENPSLPDEVLMDKIAIAEEIIISKIYNVRGKQVMLSYDLAELYQVERQKAFPVDWWIHSFREVQRSEMGVC